MEIVSIHVENSDVEAQEEQVRHGQEFSQEGSSPQVPLTVSGIALALSGCGGGEGGSGGTPPVTISPATPTPTPTPTSEPEPTSRFTARNKSSARFLLQAQFSTSVAQISSVEKVGPEAWLSQQMAVPNDSTAKQFFERRRYDEINGNREFLRSRLVDEMIWDQLLSGGSSLRKRVALALSEYFVVSVNGLDVPWPAQAVGAFWDLLNEHAFGNFRTLLEAVTLNPAMAAFLDTLGNQKEDTASGRVADENYAREVMQLFTIGLFELNQDGSLKLSNGQPLETYTNEDVQGLAKVFTGFNLDASGLTSAPDPGRPAQIVFEPEIVRRSLTPIPSKWPTPGAESQHSMSAKAFLGAQIPAGTGPFESLKLALDVLFQHPNVAPFFAKQMIQRLVTSNPSRAYIQRVATAFNDNGRGVRGDLASVFKAILLDEDASSEAALNDNRSGKLREPAIRFIQLARTFSLSADGRVGITRNLSDSASLIGQVPLRSPSVFNFFRPAYVLPRSAMQANSLVGPEFQLVNENSVAAYVNFVALTLEGTGFWLNDLLPDFSDYTPIAEDAEALVDTLDLILTAGQLRQATKSAIVEAVRSLSVGPSSDEAIKVKAVQIVGTLIMVSPDYLIQK